MRPPRRSLARAPPPSPSISEADRAADGATPGLEYIHGLQLIHTDLKPENVMFTRPLGQIFAGTPLAGSMMGRRGGEKAAGPAEGAAPAAAAAPDADAAGWADGWRHVDADWARRVASSGLVHCKLVDFGNACWTHKHFTDDIQTRQYRSPEVIMGAKYSTPVDVWSMACMTFEVATGDHLFDPRSKPKQYTRDEDHLALFMELLGKMPKRLTSRGRYAREYFNRAGELRNIRRLNFWPLDKVLEEKYKFPEAHARALASFVLPMLDFVPEKRATAAEALRAGWIGPAAP